MKRETIIDGLELFAAEAPISDKDVIAWDGHKYLVRIYPQERGRVMVEVTLLHEGGLPVMEAKYTDDDTASVHDAAWDCMSEIYTTMASTWDEQEQALADEDRAVQNKRY